MNFLPAIIFFSTALAAGDPSRGSNDEGSNRAATIGVIKKESEAHERLKLMQGTDTLPTCPAEPPKQPLSASRCYDPLSDPRISPFLSSLDKPEKFAGLQKKLFGCSLKQASTRYGIDPRLIYFRLIGESRGNPGVFNSSSKAYGIYQFLGAFAGRRSHHTRIEACQKKNPEISQTLVQTTYYVEEYMRTFKDLAKYGCKKGHKWNDYNTLEKISYLGIGKCAKENLKHTVDLCRKSENYKKISCDFANEVPDIKFDHPETPKIRLCDSFKQLNCDEDPSEEELKDDPALWCSNLAKQFE